MFKLVYQEAGLSPRANHISGIEDTLRMSCSRKRPGPSEVSRTINLVTLNLATQHDTISYPARKRVRVSVVAG